MLILTRKFEEEIKIGSEITIKVLSLSDGQVKLGITAPHDVEIYRGEIYDKVKQVTIEASLLSKQKLADLSKLKLNKIRKLTDKNG
jgi:carbon storage regulator